MWIVSMEWGLFSRNILQESSEQLQYTQLAKIKVLSYYLMAKPYVFLGELTIKQSLKKQHINRKLTFLLMMGCYNNGVNEANVF